MANINFKRLFKLRLTVARFGEMDNAAWWNTKGILGRYGVLTLSRGFPKTHRFTQAGIAFAVAGHRCKGIYSHPGACTLWDLPAHIEDRFCEKWHEWLDDSARWTPFFKSLEDISGMALLDVLKEIELITPEQIEQTQRLRRSSEGRSVHISGFEGLNNDVLTFLAAGFFRGEPGKPAIPYISLPDTAIGS